MRDPLDRFVEKMDVDPSGCWLWTAALDTYGYGTFYNEGRMGQAYKYAYVTSVGPVPPGLELDHVCRTRRCVNPDHLEPVTHAENVRRGDRARPVAERLGSAVV